MANKRMFTADEPAAPASVSRSGRRRAVHVEVVRVPEHDGECGRGAALRRQPDSKSEIACCRCSCGADSSPSSQSSRVSYDSDIHTDHNSSIGIGSRACPTKRTRSASSRARPREPHRPVKNLPPAAAQVWRAELRGGHPTCGGARRVPRRDAPHRRDRPRASPPPTSSSRPWSCASACAACHGPASRACGAALPWEDWATRGAGASLYVDKEGEDAKLTHEAWSDHYCCDWPEAGSATARAYGLHGGGGGTAPGGEVRCGWRRQRARLAQGATDSWGGRAVVTFSHFLGSRGAHQ